MSILLPREGEISEGLRAWMALDGAARVRAAPQVVSEWGSTTLLAYSECMASRAVRERDENLILLGLVALGIDDWQADWRENLLIVCLHFDAAERIGAAPETIFDTAASLLPENSAQGLRSFPRRNERDRSLAAMGYVAASGHDGFTYRRTW